MYSFRLGAYAWINSPSPGTTTGVISYLQRQAIDYSIRHIIVVSVVA